MIELAEVVPKAIGSVRSTTDWILILGVITTSIVTILNAWRSSTKRQELIDTVKAEGVAATEKAKEAVIKAEVVTEKATLIHEQTTSSQRDLKKELETANRHIKNQEMLLMVLLRRADLADVGIADIDKPAVKVITVPPVVVAGNGDDGVVVVGGTRYLIKKANGPTDPEKK